MRTVLELSRNELDELKQSYITEKLGSPSYKELSDSQEIPDEVIFKHYADIQFGTDDFFCNCAGTIDD